MQHTIAERVRTARIRAGLSQRELSEPVGVSFAYISRIEAGVRNPSVKVLRRMAPPLGVTVEWLETGRAPIEVEGPLTQKLVRDLLKQAAEQGVRQRRRVRLRVEEVV